jgi:hypothetical protein
MALAILVSFASVSRAPEAAASFFCEGKTIRISVRNKNETGWFFVESVKGH